MKYKFFLAIIVFLSFFLPLRARAESSQIDIKNLAECLRDKDFKMYGVTRCHACDIQKGYFGEYFALIKYINCENDSKLCGAKNIHAYPTWEDGSGRQYKGAITPEVFMSLSGCTGKKSIPEKNTVIKSVIISGIFNQLVGAFIAGLISFLAPCLLPLLPSYFSIISGFTFADLYGLDFGRIRWRVFISTLFFVTGFTVVYTILGATGSVVGQLLDKYLPILLKTSGVILIVLGLLQVGVIKPFSLQFDFAWRVQKRLTHLGYITAVVTGIAVALCWIPCVSPLLTPILILSAKSETVIYGAFLLFVYSLGLTLPFVLGGLFFPTVFRMLQEHRQAFHRASVIAGIFLIIFGVILILDQYRLFIDNFNILVGYLVKFSI